MIHNGITAPRCGATYQLPPPPPPPKLDPPPHDDPPPQPPLPGGSYDGDDLTNEVWLTNDDENRGDVHCDTSDGVTYDGYRRDMDMR